MKDTELQDRLQALGMPTYQAARLTAHVRDELLPVAAIATVRMNDHLEGLAAYHAYGDAGLSGYVYDAQLGFLKKVKKAVKKVAKTATNVVKKVALPVAAVVAAPVTGGASIAAYGAVKAAQIGKKTQKSANEAAIAQTNAMITGEPVGTSSPKPAPQGQARERVRVPRAITRKADEVAAQAVQQGYPADTASLLQAMMAYQGSNMVSPAAQEIVREVAMTGVQPTAEGPSSLPPWLVPAGIGLAALVGVMAFRKKSR